MDKIPERGGAPPPEIWHKTKAGQDLPDLHRLSTINHSVVGPEKEVWLAFVKLQSLDDQLAESTWQQWTAVHLGGCAPCPPVVDVGEVVAVELLPETANTKSNLGSS